MTELCSEVHNMNISRESFSFTESAFASISADSFSFNISDI